jgi:hypothetical protein
MILRSLLCTAFFQLVTLQAVHAEVSPTNQKDSAGAQEASISDEGGISAEMQAELRRREVVRKQIEELERAELESELSAHQRQNVKFQDTGASTQKTNDKSNGATNLADQTENEEIHQPRANN